MVNPSNIHSSDLNSFAHRQVDKSGSASTGLLGDGKSIRLSDDDPARFWHLADRSSSATQQAIISLATVLSEGDDLSGLKLATELLGGFGSVQAILGSSKERLLRNGVRQRQADNLICISQLIKCLLTEQIASKPVISSSKSLIEMLRFQIGICESERVHVVYLDCSNILINHETIFLGSVDRCILSPREIIRRALEINATGIIVAHNHPSGQAVPTEEDLRSTSQLLAAARLFGIEIKDHIIVSPSDAFSIFERRILDE